MKFPEIDFTPVSHPYPETTMFGAVAASAKRVPDAPALNFMGKYTTYKEFVEKIEMTAGAFLKAGIKKDDISSKLPYHPSLYHLYFFNASASPR